MNLQRIDEVLTRRTMLTIEKGVVSTIRFSAYERSLLVNIPAYIQKWIINGKEEGTRNLTDGDHAEIFNINERDPIKVMIMYNILWMGHHKDPERVYKHFNKIIKLFNQSAMRDPARYRPILFEYIQIKTYQLVYNDQLEPFGYFKEIMDKNDTSSETAQRALWGHLNDLCGFILTMHEKDLYRADSVFQHAVHNSNHN